MSSSQAGTAATPFEADMAEQPEALRRLAGSTLPDLAPVTQRSWDRIVLTGMGSSHFAALPTWRDLTALGHHAWAVDTGQLLDNEGLLTPQTLLIVTSQSGASGEVAELLDRRANRTARGVLVGVTDDEDSPLARAADLIVPLHSGKEATVSTKSYLNTLAVHRLLRAAFSRQDTARVQASELVDAADAVQDLLSRVELAEPASAVARHPARRLAYVGARNSAGTALFAALITKEAAKVPAEGYIGGQFRHGPFELAGDGLTVMVLAPDRGSEDGSLRRLAADLIRTGTRVVVVGDPGCASTTTVEVGGTSALAFAAASAAVAELFAVDLARANGVTPGAFLHGSKITTTT